MILPDNIWPILLLLKNKGSFLIHYNREYLPWFFVENDEAFTGYPLAKEIAENLREQNIICPVVSELEYKVQYALGTMNGRIYELNPEVNINKLLLIYGDTRTIRFSWEKFK
jgi:hypothetical protein